MATGGSGAGLEDAEAAARSGEGLGDGDGLGDAVGSGDISIARLPTIRSPYQAEKTE